MRLANLDDLDYVSQLIRLSLQAESAPPVESPKTPGKKTTGKGGPASVPIPHVFTPGSYDRKSIEVPQLM